MKKRNDHDSNYSQGLEYQKRMCDEAMSLVNSGVAMQNSGDQEGAERNLSKAVDIMEKALAIEYKSQEEQEAAARLNNKMNRYVKMIKSQRAKTPGGSTASKRSANKYNILDMERLPERYHPIVHMFTKYVQPLVQIIISKPNVMILF